MEVPAAGGAGVDHGLRCRRGRQGCTWGSCCSSAPQTAGWRLRAKPISRLHATGQRLPELVRSCIKLVPQGLQHDHAGFQLMTPFPGVPRVTFSPMPAPPGTPQHFAPPPPFPPASSLLQSTSATWATTSP